MENFITGIGSSDRYLDQYGTRLDVIHQEEELPTMSSSPFRIAAELADTGLHTRCDDRGYVLSVQNIQQDLQSFSGVRRNRRKLLKDKHFSKARTDGPEEESSGKPGDGLPVHIINRSNDDIIKDVKVAAFKVKKNRKARGWSSTSNDDTYTRLERFSSKIDSEHEEAKKNEKSNSGPRPEWLLPIVLNFLSEEEARNKKVTDPKQKEANKAALAILRKEFQKMEYEHNEDMKENTERYQESRALRTANYDKLSKLRKKFDKKYRNKYPPDPPYKAYDPEKELKILMADLKKKRKSYPNTAKGRVDGNRAAVAALRDLRRKLRKNQKDPKYLLKTDPETRRRNRKFMRQFRGQVREVRRAHRVEKRAMKADKRKGKMWSKKKESWKGDSNKDLLEAFSNNSPRMPETKGGQKKSEEEGTEGKSDIQERTKAVDEVEDVLAELRANHARANKQGLSKAQRKKVLKNLQKQDQHKIRSLIKKLEKEIENNPQDKQTQEINKAVVKDLKKQFPKLKL